MTGAFSRQSFYFGARGLEIIAVAELYSVETLEYLLYQVLSLQLML